MSKNEIIQLARANKVNAAYSGNTGTIHFKGETKAVNSLVLKLNMMGKKKVPFTLVKEIVA